MLTRLSRLSPTQMMGIMSFARRANGSYVCEVLVTDKAVYDAMMSDAYWKELQKYARSKSSKVDKIKRQASYTKGVQVVHYDIVYK